MVGQAAEQVPDSTVLHRAVLDHTQLCEVCRGQGGGCPYLARLTELSRAASEAE